MRRRALIAVAIASALAATSAAETYRGIEVAPERRCSPYDPDHYAYPQSVEQRIVDDLDGLVFGPYTGTCFADRGQTDIEHIVARSEAHDSGLCARDAATRAAFARDPLNLTLASPAVNRHRKGAKDVADWSPERNACWFAARTIEVRRRYGLTIDAREAAAVERLLAGCVSTDMVVSCRATVVGAAPASVRDDADADADALERYDDNGNGRITCAEARRHGIAPVPRGHPAYRFMRDGDGDGVVCE